MTYRRALKVLTDRQETRIELGLARIRRHLRRLGDPQESYATIHVAGTNGKGSVCAMLESVLRAAGLRTGFYLSPHLEDVRERIRVDGGWISPAEFAELAGRTLRAETREKLTYFEFLTSMAFQHFRERRVDVAVLETGLGGRFDATNVVKSPLATVVPAIDFDHMDFLGKTLASIAREKAGIFKRGRPALTAETKPKALGVLRSAAERAGAPFTAVAKDSWKVEKVRWRSGSQILRGPGGRRVEVGLLGLAQARNTALVLEAVDKLRAAGWVIPDAAVARGLAKVRWPGRFEVLPSRSVGTSTDRTGARTIVLDGAHNPQAMRNFIATLEASPWRRSRKGFVLGFLRDKQHREMVRLLAQQLRTVIATEPPSPRALSAGDLAMEIRDAAPGAHITVLSDPLEALRTAISAGSKSDVVCVCGSFYLVGLARTFWS